MHGSPERGKKTSQGRSKWLWEIDVVRQIARDLPGVRETGFREFPGSPVVRTLCFHCRGHRFDPWSGN